MLPVLTTAYELSRFLSAQPASRSFLFFCIDAADFTPADPRRLADYIATHIAGPVPTKDVSLAILATRTPSTGTTMATFAIEALQHGLIIPCAEDGAGRTPLEFVGCSRAPGVDDVDFFVFGNALRTISHGQIQAIMASGQRDRTFDLGFAAMLNQALAILLQQKIELMEGAAGRSARMAA
jgi:hypothetical protein